MKTSNKILLGALITVVLILSSLHIAIYAKYKMGEVTVMDNHSGRYTTHKINGRIKYVKANGLTRFVIFPSDTLKLELQKDVPGTVRFEVRQDTLIINVPSADERVNRRYYQEVNLFLPSAEKIVADFCEMEIHGSADTLNAKSYTIQLIKSNCVLGNNHNDKMNYYKSMIISAEKNSSLVLSVRSNIGLLDFSSNASKFIDEGAQVGKFSVVADNTSHFEMNGKTLEALNANRK